MADQQSEAAIDIAKPVERYYLVTVQLSLESRAVLIEQAIFTSARSDRAAGYHVVAQSPGIDERDARELASWGPSHDSLLVESSDAASVNFFRLPSGRFCVSRTSPGGQEYSERRGPQVYTQFFIVAPEILGKFANNPFAILRAALAKGVVQVHEEIPPQLSPFQLGGRTSSVDADLLQRLTIRPGAAALTALIEAALANEMLAIKTLSDPEQLIAGLFNLLPVPCRLDFSFSTGLKFSPRRPFRLLVLGRDEVETRRMQRQFEVPVLDLLTQEPPLPVALGWAGYVARMLAAGKVTALASQVEKIRTVVSKQELDDLGDQLLHKLAGSKPGRAVPVVLPNDQKSRSPSDSNLRAHGMHERFAPKPGITVVTPSASAATSASKPADVLGQTCPQVLEQLELLDDAVFEAIGGNQEALERLKNLWPELTTQLPLDLVEESRSQYLRYAIAIWDHCQQEGIREPQRAVDALDVLCLLFDDR